MFRIGIYYEEALAATAVQDRFSEAEVCLGPGVATGAEAEDEAVTVIAHDEELINAAIAVRLNRMRQQASSSQVAAVRQKREQV